MKINVGIVGYGNLGKAVEKCVLSSKELNLVAIFSRRMVTSLCSTLVEPYEKFRDYAGKIDVMLLCGGSKSDLEVQTPEVLEYFDCINTFDTHARLKSEYDRLGKIAKKHGHRLIMACGWDPGLFSVIRAINYAISDNDSITFWGKGISMGHSDAIRRVDGVIDGVQFTVPIKEALSLAKKGKLPANMPLHSRECYVVSAKKDESRIENEIKNIPNYFLGQPTNVHFVSQDELIKLKRKMYHKGEIINSFRTVHKSKCTVEFKVSMQSNPNFTASIVCAYICAVINFKQQGQSGAFTCLDVPPSYLFLGKKKESLIEHLC